MKPLITTLMLCLACAGTQAQYKFTRIADVNPGSPDSHYPDGAELVVYNDKLFFTAFLQGKGAEPFYTDGTEPGTAILKDIYKGGLPSIASSYTNFDGLLFFKARDSACGTELWRTDGTESGTFMVRDVFPTLYNGIRSPGFTPFKGKMYFAGIGDPYTGIELWETDGTYSGTRLTKDLVDYHSHPVPFTFDSNPAEFAVQGNKMYFTARDTLSGAFVLYETDGTTAGTTRVSTGTASNIPMSSFRIFNGGIYYTKQGGELWMYEIATGINALVKDIDPRSNTIFNTDYIAMNSKLYFTANDSVNGSELWVTDGTAAGTKLVKDIYPGTAGSFPGIAGSLAFNNKLYFRATDTANNSELWVSDGTDTGTRKFFELVAGDAGSQFAGFITYKDKLYFAAAPAPSTNKWQWFATDGTTAGTQFVSPHPQSDTNYYITPMAVLFNDAMHFFARYDTTGIELWSLEDTSTPPTHVAATPAANGITLYPNPASGYCTIKTTAMHYNAIVNITDITGRLVKTNKIQSQKPSNTFPVELNGIPPGIYIVNMQLDDKRSTQRLVIQ